MPKDATSTDLSVDESAPDRGQRTDTATNADVNPSRSDREHHGFSASQNAGSGTSPEAPIGALRMPHADRSYAPMLWAALDGARLAGPAGTRVVSGQTRP